MVPQIVFVFLASSFQVSKFLYTYILALFQKTSSPCQEVNHADFVDFVDFIQFDSNYSILFNIFNITHMLKFYQNQLICKILKNYSKITRFVAKALCLKPIILTLTLPLKLFIIYSKISVWFAKIILSMLPSGAQDGKKKNCSNFVN
jgi:hypothetical protein